jgi:hypothetical protein
MRRTLFVFSVEDLPAVRSGVSLRVAEAESRRLVRDVERAGLRRDGVAWLGAAGRAVLEVLDDGRELTSTQLRAEIPLLEGTLTYGRGRRWGGAVPVGPRVLTVLQARGLVVRASNDGSWTVSRPRWTTLEAWIGAPLEPMEPRDGLAAVVRRWLASYGPGTLADLKWWLGGTLTATRQALADVGAVEVDLEGTPGYVLPEDLDPVEDVEPWAALLPELDPATMGWAGRDWYLGGHRAQLFDTFGNGGNTAWWGGRIVGGWTQAATGEVLVEPLEDLDPAARRALELEAGRLTDWLAGDRVTGRYPSPLVKRAAAGVGGDGT